MQARWHLGWWYTEASERHCLVPGVTIKPLVVTRDTHGATVVANITASTTTRQFTTVKKQQQLENSASAHAMCDPVETAAAARPRMAAEGAWGLSYVS